MRTRMLVTDISRWEEIGRPTASSSAPSCPATSMVEVSRSDRSVMLVEIEADAVCDEG